MTHEQWMTLLGPVLSALVLGVAGVLGVVLTGLSGKLGAYLAAHGSAATAAVVEAASARVQAAMQNSAGQLVMKAQSGQLDLTNFDQVRAEAAREAATIAAKLPDAMAVLAPVAGSVAQGVVGKLGAMVAAGAATVLEVPAPPKAAA